MPAELVDEVIAELRVTPVITAHPTEVRRQTILRVVNEVADLLDERDRLDTGDPAVGRDRRSADDLHHHALADGPAPPVEAAGPRRDQRSAPLLRREPVRDRAGPDERTRIDGAEAAGVATGRCHRRHPDGLVDRGRPRRQPVRHRRRPALRHRAAGGHGARPPPARAGAPLGRVVDVGPADHAHRRRCSRSPDRPATTHRSGPTSPTAAPCAACTPGCTPSPSASCGVLSRRSTRLRPASPGSRTSRSTSSSTISTS